MSTKSNSNHCVDKALIDDLEADKLHIPDSDIEPINLDNPHTIWYIGTCYYFRNDFEKARRWWSSPPVTNYGLAQLDLGCLFFHGQGVEENLDLAEYYFHEAASNGIKIAAHYIGIVHSSRGYHKTAIDYYRKAAENKFAPAQHAIGICYMNGEGVEQDFQTSMEWLQLSAEQGCQEAQYDIGYLLENGYGVEIDKENALEWYTKSYAQGFEPALDRIKDLNQQGYLTSAERKVRLLLDYFPMEQI